VLLEGDFVADVENKEPIYMKWWAWIAIFLITAVIVNSTSDEGSEYEEAQHVVDIESTENSQVDEDDTLAVMATVDADINETHDDPIDYDSPATFLVGTDIPTGEYFVMAGAGEFGYILLTRSRYLDIHEIIWQKHFENHTIINLRDGEYLTTDNATLIPLDDAIVPNFENGILRAGTYRVGVDIPPGVYTLHPLEEKMGYFEASTSSHYLEAHTVARRNFSEPITIALNIGDYFTLMRAEIKK